MSREKSLLKNIIIYSIGNFGSKFLGFILLPYYTYYLSATDYGYYDLVVTTIALFTPLITFQMFDGLYRFLLDAKDQNERTEVITNSFLVVFRNLVIINLAYLILTCFISFRYKYLVLLQLDTSIALNMWLQIARGLRDNLKYSIAGILTTIFTLMGNIILISVFNMKVNGLIISNAVAAAVAVLFLDYTLKINKYINLSKSNPVLLKKLKTFSIPLIPNVLSWWFMNVSDRYILNLFEGMQSNGIYAVANKFPSILMIVNSIFYLAWQESAIAEYQSVDRDHYYSKMFNRFMIIQFTVIIVLLSFTRYLMSFMINEKFGSAWLYVPFLYFGTIFAAFSSFYGTGYLSSKDTRGAFTSSIYGALTNILLNILLVPYIGIQGASLSTLLAFLVVWILRIIQTQKYFVIKINYFNLISLAVISVIFTWLYYIGNQIIQLLSIMMGTVIFLVYNNELIKTIFMNCLKFRTEG